ncbi:MAG: glycosyltransferase [Candidatus Heimdallarchaeota archaeon]|nr:glycosyltransferase [Candidatus Heimdallarchaeota archaeon]
MSLPVSVVIPSYNRARSLYRTLLALHYQTSPPNEVIVINDHSSDDTRLILDRLRAKSLNYHLIVIHNRNNAGPSISRNKGILAATQPFVAFTDDDCIPAQNWLTVMYERLDQENTNNNAIIGIGGKVLALNQDLVSQYYDLHHILDPPSSEIYLVTANCMYFRDVLLEVNGFDETIKVPGGEDPGLSFALSNLGYQFYFTQDAVVHHDYQQTLKSFIKTFYRYGKGCHYVTARYK